MKTKSVLLTTLLLFIQLFAIDDETKYNYYHMAYPSTPYITTVGGIDLPSTGTINVLFVFCQFPDDKYDITNSAWPKGGVPTNYNTWVDETWSSNSTPYSMTDYFNQMSLTKVGGVYENKLHFTAKKVSVITPHSRKWYAENNRQRGYIHEEIIRQLDITGDFAEFDNWKKVSNYTHDNVSDTKVDWVCFIWRNIAMEYSERLDTTRNWWMNKLNMGWYGSTGMGTVYVDGGARKFTSAGATIADYFYKDAFRFTIHEFAHYLLGGNDQHNGHAFWAMLSGYEVRSYMINALERAKLGWGNIVTVNNTTQTLSNISLLIL